MSKINTNLCLPRMEAAVRKSIFNGKGLMGSHDNINFGQLSTLKSKTHNQSFREVGDNLGNAEI